jgi:hypothetical protein
VGLGVLDDDLPGPAGAVAVGPAAVGDDDDVLDDADLAGLVVDVAPAVAAELAAADAGGSGDAEQHPEFGVHSDGGLEDGDHLGLGRPVGVGAHGAGFDETAVGG